MSKKTRSRQFRLETLEGRELMGGWGSSLSVVYISKPVTITHTVEVNKNVAIVNASVSQTNLALGFHSVAISSAANNTTISQSN